MLTIGRSATCKEHSVDLHRISKTNCDILINCCVVVQYFEGNVLRFQPFLKFLFCLRMYLESENLLELDTLQKGHAHASDLPRNGCVVFKLFEVCLKDLSN